MRRRGQPAGQGSVTGAPVWTSRGRPIVLVGLLGLAALLVPGAFAAGRLCAEPLDVSGTTRLPPWLADLKDRDELAYPLHVGLGAALDRAGCEPAAVGLQWLKAAAHAREPAEVGQMAAGLAATRQRSRSVEQLQDVLCRYVARGFARPEQAAAFAEAGFSCGPARPRRRHKLAVGGKRPAAG